MSSSSTITEMYTAISIAIQNAESSPAYSAYPNLSYLSIQEQKNLLEIAIDKGNPGFVMALLQNNQNLLSMPLEKDGYRPIVSAAKKGKWDIVAKMASYSNSYPNLDFGDFYKALLIALYANTPESHRAARSFNLNSVCTGNKYFKNGNNILHHAMHSKSEMNSITHILTTLHDEGLLCTLVREKNKSGQTAIQLAATEKNWLAVEQHAKSYIPRNQNDITTLYAPILSTAIQDGTPAALNAALALISAVVCSTTHFVENFQFNIDWIATQIQNTIVGKKIADALINQVFSSLLALADTPEKRISIIVALAKISKKEGKNREHIKKIDADIDKDNIIDLIAQINNPLLKMDIILNFLEDKSSPIWLQTGFLAPTLLNGTREKLIYILIKEFEQINLSQCDPKKIADFVKRAVEMFYDEEVDVKSTLNIKLMACLIEVMLKQVKPSELEYSELVNFNHVAELITTGTCPSTTKLSWRNWKDDASINILKDFLLIIIGKQPLFQKEHLDENQLKHVKNSIMVLYTTCIQKNTSLQKLFLSNLLSEKIAKSDSVILSALQNVAKTDLEALSRASSELLYSPLGNSHPQPSAPPLTTLPTHPSMSHSSSSSHSVLMEYPGAFLARPQPSTLDSSSMISSSSRIATPPAENPSHILSSYMWPSVPVTPPTVDAVKQPVNPQSRRTAAMSQN